MKNLVAVITLVVCVAAEPPAPYAPSGWRPEGPAFVLPQRAPAQQQPQSQEYLPPALPVDPRRPILPNDVEADVSVHGLPPSQEQTPQFQLSPVSGRQYVGPAVNYDIRNLDDQYRQAQFQAQQQTFREIARQRQLYGAPTHAPQVPRQFARPAATPATEATTATTESEFRTTTDALNDREVLSDDDQSVPAKQKQAVSVEVTKQNIQEYPAELFLNPLAQLSLQAAYPGQQFGQLILQPGVPELSQKQAASAGYDGPIHFAALTSILSQRQIAGQPQGVVQNQQSFIQNPAVLVPRGQESSGFVLLPQSPEIQAPLKQYQPLVQAIQPQVQQYQLQLLQSQAQLNQYGQPNQPNANPEQKDTEIDGENNEEQNGNKNQPQFVAQQPQYYQPQEIQIQTQPQVIYQPQSVQPQFQQPQLAAQPQYTPQAYQPHEVEYQGQPQFAYQPQPATQPQFQQPQGYQPQPAVQPQFFNPQPQAYQPQGVQLQGQPQSVQPQLQYQHQEVQFQGQQPQLQYQPQDYQQGQLLLNQPQIMSYQPIVNQDQSQYYQNQQQLLLQQQQIQNQGQNALQSGINTQQGNELDETDGKEGADDGNNQSNGSRATAVATAFGARTRPRVYTRYGAPAPVPDTQQPTTEREQDEANTEEGPVVAVATAEATGERRKSAKLRSRRVRPVFTLDRSGHLVLAQEQ